MHTRDALCLNTTSYHMPDSETRLQLLTRIDNHTQIHNTACMCVCAGTLCSRGTGHVAQLCAAACGDRAAVLQVRSCYSRAVSHSNGHQQERTGENDAFAHASPPVDMHLSPTPQSSLYTVQGCILPVPGLAVPQRQLAPAPRGGPARRALRHHPQPRRLLSAGPAAPAQGPGVPRGPGRVHAGEQVCARMCVCVTVVCVCVYVCVCVCVCVAVVCACVHITSRSWSTHLQSCTYAK